MAVAVDLVVADPAAVAGSAVGTFALDSFAAGCRHRRTLAAVAGRTFLKKVNHLFIFRFFFFFSFSCVF